MQLSGKIYRIDNEQKVSDTFSKREFIIETDEQYKNHILIQVVKDKCAVLNQYKVGDSVTVDLNVKGRLWTGNDGIEKCFNTLECWKISKITDANPSTVNSYKERTPTPHPNNDEAQDLPF